MRDLLSLSLLTLLGTSCQSPQATPTPTADIEKIQEAAVAKPSGSAWSCSPRLALSSVWDFLAKKYDANHDGRITAREYDRGETRFANYDRNTDGVLTAGDFPPDTFFNGFSYMLVARADDNKDEKITTAEWSAFTNRIDSNGDGNFEQSEVEAVMSWANDWPLFLLSFDQDSDGDFDATDLELTFRDQDFDGDGVLAGRETRGWQPTVERPSNRPPAVGAAAPNFDLPFANDPQRTFELATAIGSKPIALVFGSYT